MYLMYYYNVCWLDMIHIVFGKPTRNWVPHMINIQYHHSMAQMQNTHTCVYQDYIVDWMGMLYLLLLLPCIYKYRTVYQNCILVGRYSIDLVYYCNACHLRIVCIDLLCCPSSQAMHMPHICHHYLASVYSMGTSICLYWCYTLAIHCRDSNSYQHLHYRQNPLGRIGIL